MSGWEDIVAIYTMDYYTVGLASDGTVVIAGNRYNDKMLNAMQDWEDIVAISVGLFHSVGLKSDGTNVAFGNNMVGQCDVTDWNLN